MSYKYLCPIHGPQWETRCEECPREGDILQNGRVKKPARKFGKRPELAMGYGMSSLRFPAWWTCRCSACEQQRQEKDQDLYAQIANGGC